MERFRIDSINQMAIKQIAAVSLPETTGPFVLGRPDPSLQDLAPDAHPLTTFLIRLMHDEALEPEVQNEMAAAAVQVIRFGDLDPILQHVHEVVLMEGRPQHVVTLKLNKVLRDVLHLAHAHQQEFLQVFAEAEPKTGAVAPPPKPPPEKQRVILINDPPPAAIEPQRWSPIRQASAYAPPAVVSERTVERVVERHGSTVSPAMVAFGVGLLAVPISIGVGAVVGFNSGAPDGWGAFFLTLLPSAALVALIGSIGHLIWKYSQEDR
ncbi:MAG: hypothetical protein ACREJ2_05995 [Planctomycetota bacterium]